MSFLQFAVLWTEVVLKVASICNVCSTPAISKMHSDDSPELKLVKIILEDIFEVSCFFFPVMVLVTKSVSSLQ